MRVAGIQFEVGNDVSKNCAAIVRGIEKAAKRKADILLMPEGALSGYTHAFAQEEVGAAVEQLRALAAEKGLALALATCYYEDDGKCYNQIRVYDKQGNLQGTHAKILRCGNPDDLESGEKTVYGSAPLRTFELGGVCFGCLICNDLWANPEWTEEEDPHLTRKLVQMGAKLVLQAVNSGAVDTPYMKTVKQYHESNLAIRSKADHLYIVTVNSSYEDGPCSCSSGVVAPGNGFVLKVPGTGERFFCTDLPL